MTLVDGTSGPLSPSESLRAAQGGWSATTTRPTGRDCSSEREEVRASSSAESVELQRWLASDQQSLLDVGTAPGPIMFLVKSTTSSIRKAPRVSPLGAGRFSKSLRWRRNDSDGRMRRIWDLSAPWSLDEHSTAPVTTGSQVQRLSISGTGWSLDAKDYWRSWCPTRPGVVSQSFGPCGILIPRVAGRTT
jgi:hypothetical protein